MNALLKVIVAILTVTTGVLLGIYLLDISVWWRVVLFAASCTATGYLVYAILRAIDAKFPTK